MAWTMDKAPRVMAKIPEFNGMPTSGSVTACATAAHAATEGAKNGQEE